MSPLLEQMEEQTLLTAEECREVRTAVYDLEAHWTRRHPQVPFFTLGVASYLDARRDAAAGYHAAARRLNPLLGERFGWLHGRLADRLSRVLAAPVVYRASCALPGFHIFEWCLAFEQPVGSVHQDLQYQYLDWRPAEQQDFRNPISFTLAIALPRTGGGLRVWDAGHEELGAWTRQRASS